MKINQEFAPLTVVIDDSEDLELLLEALWEASRKGTAMGREWNDKEQKMYHLYQQLHKFR